MAVSGQASCHCGQNLPAYLMGPWMHVRPSGGACRGIDPSVHVPGICWECREGTHSAEFLRVLDVIAWETRPEGDGY